MSIPVLFPREEISSCLFVASSSAGVGLLFTISINESKFFSSKASFFFSVGRLVGIGIFSTTFGVGFLNDPRMDIIVNMIIKKSSAIIIAIIFFIF